MDGGPERAAKKAKHGGRRCVAGGPNSISCGNSEYTDGVSVHLFPNKEKDSKRYNAWMRFSEIIGRVFNITQDPTCAWFIPNHFVPQEMNK